MSRASKSRSIAERRLADYQAVFAALDSPVRRQILMILQFRGGQMTSVGITCALCHSDVDDSFAPGIGRRRDGWAARDLDIGKILASVEGESFLSLTCRSPSARRRSSESDRLWESQGL